MPDIAMCNARCPASATCKRHTDSGTIPGAYQSWLWRESTPEGANDCQYYWLIEEKTK